MNQKPISQIDQEILGIEPDKAKPKTTFFKFETNVDKKYYFGILGSKTPKLLPVEKILIHYNFYNPNKDKNGAFPCLTMKGIPCPLCRVYEKMRDSSNFEQNAKAEDFKAQESYYMYVVGIQTNEIGVLRFTGKRAFEAITNKIREICYEGVTTFSDPSKIVVLEIHKRGFKQNVKYSVIKVQSSLQLSPDQIEAYEDLAPLNEFFGNYTTEDYEKILRGEKFGDPFAKTKELSAQGMLQQPELTVSTSDVSSPSIEEIQKMMGMN